MQRRRFDSLFIRIFLLQLLVLPISQSQAREQDLLLDFSAGLNLLGSFTNNDNLGTTNRVGYFAGAMARNFSLLSSDFGLFLGVQYVNRGANLNNGTTVSASFIDVPFGLTKKIEWKSKNFRALPFLGAFVGVPLGSLTNGTSFTQATKTSIGGILGADLVYTFERYYSLGLSLFGKYGFSDALTPTTAGPAGQIVDLGVGATFFYEL